VPQVPPEELRGRLAQRIREVAKRKGITLTDLADRAGVSQAGFWLAMGGKSGPSIDFVAKVAMALDVDPSVLVRPSRKPRSPAT
jgi:transcriptional regulator with XRE-family HTH domain